MVERQHHNEIPHRPPHPYTYPKVGRDGSSRGGRGGRLRIGRDAKDTDVLKRFSSKLEDALGKNDETRRHRGGRGDDSRDRERGGRGGGERGRGPRGDESRDRERGRRGDDCESGGRGGGEGGGRGEDRRNGEAESGVSGRERHRQEEGRGRRGDAVATAADRARSGGGKAGRREDYDNHREEEDDSSSRGRTRGEDIADGGGGGGSWRERQARDWKKGERALDGDRRDRAGDEGGRSRGRRGEAGGRDGSRHRGDRSDRVGEGRYSLVDAGGDRTADRAGEIGGRARRDDSRDRRPGSGGGSSRGERASVREAGTPREADGQVDSSTIAVGSKDDGLLSSGEGRGGGREEAGANSSKAGRPRVGDADVRGRPVDVVRKTTAAAAAAVAVVETAVPSARTPPGDRVQAPGLGKAAGVAEAAKAKATPTPKKLLTEAELTKLAVAAMKAKLKGDKASHARLIEEVRLGVECRRYLAPPSLSFLHVFRQSEANFGGIDVESHSLVFCLHVFRQSEVNFGGVDVECRFSLMCVSVV